MRTTVTIDDGLLADARRPTRGRVTILADTSVWVDHLGDAPADVAGRARRSRKR